ncbi:retrovirus-related pol polyprotein from transposon TNT 1-94 [Tanacetum coccineum]
MGCCLTSWFSKKQTALAISTTEAEYVSAGKACQQALWMKQALVDYGIRLDDIPIMCDNKGAIDLSKNPVQHSRTKHIEIRHHFLRDNVQKGNISIEKVSSEDNIADILTKPLKREPFNYLRLGNRSQLMNFVSKFLGTVRFRNDQVAKIMGSKDEAPNAIIKCIKNIQVRLNATIHNVQTDNGTEFVNQTLRDFYENVGISHQTSVARTPQQNRVVERRNRTLVEDARTMLIFSKAPLFLWAEAINTACYTQNHSLIRLRYNKTPYELMYDKKPDLSFFHVFGSLCYPTNDNEDFGKLNAKDDIAVASEQFGSGPGLQVMTPATSSSRLVPNIIPQKPCNPSKRDDWDNLFQPLFDEYFNPPTIVVSIVPVAVAPRAIEIVDPHVSTSIDQDAPSL